jgi:hypothetical protein
VAAATVGYHCQWATDTVQIVLAGQLSREAHNAPLHLFSASPELVGFGQKAYRQRSQDTSLLLGQLLETFRGEGFAMSYTMEDFKRDLTKEYFKELSPQEQREILRSMPSEKRRELMESWPLEDRRELMESLPLEDRLAGLSPEQIRQYLDKLTADRPAAQRKPRRKK